MNIMNANTKHNIELHIEKLVLDGFPAVDQHRIAAAVEKELSRLLGTGEIPEGLKRNDLMEKVDGGTLEIGPGNSAESTGIGIARSIYGGLKK